MNRNSNRCAIWGVILQALALPSFSQPPGALVTHAGEQRPATYVNPLDLDYRFALDLPSRREAADPTMVVYRGEYWLFASKSAGYWHSPDLLHWTHIYAQGYPVEAYAPTVVEIEGRLYLSAADEPGVYTTDDPVSGRWHQVAEMPPFRDPDLFLDDDHKLYMFSGCSDRLPLRVTELDSRTFAAQSSRTTVIIDPAHHGWQVRGDANQDETDAPWLEGSWMTRHGGNYYLQYSVPGTQDKAYTDGVAVSDSPVGPFVPAPYSPVSLKSTGFMTGAGHSSTFQDQAGRFWHVSTMTISSGICSNGGLASFPQASPGMVRCGWTPTWRIIPMCSLPPVNAIWPAGCFWTITSLSQPRPLLQVTRPSLP